MPRPRPTALALAAIALLLAVAALTLATGQAGAAKAWPGCKAFHSQPEAQARWIALGQPAGADGDRDGRVCEALPATAPAPAPGTGGGACVKAAKVVDVGLSRDKYPHVLAHARAAIAKGWPRIMVVNRRGADRRRDRLLAHVPTKPGYDRDEYPMAAGRGRGAAALRRGRDPVGWRADVRYVPSGENRGAGSVVGIKLRRYCDGTSFRYVAY